MSAVIQNEYTGNNSTTTYSFTFPYLKTSDIKASLDGVATTAFTLPNATTLQFNTAPGSGVKIKIFRETSVDDLTATFYAGSAIKSEDLNDNFTQNLYKTQEVGARALNTLGGTMTGDLAMGEATKIIFEGATDDAHETTLTVADPTADRTITFPNVTGTVVTTGDTGTVATAMIAGDAVNGDKIADNAINSEHYTDGSIDRVHLAADIVDGTKIADDSINSEHYAAGSIDTEHIANQQITNDKIANSTIQGNTKIVQDSITGVQIAANSIGASELADNAVDTAAIINNAVTQAKIANDSVGTAELIDGSVDSDRLAANSVTLAKMTDSSVGTSELVNDSVTNAKIADDQIDSEHYVDQSIDSQHLADNAVTNAKLADDAVGSNELGNGVIDTVHIGTAQITNSLLASNAVTEAKITDANITEAKLAANSVTISKIGCEQTTLTDSDSHIPTSGAVVDYVYSQIAPIGGLEVIANEVSFPNSAPATGVVISISDAGGIVVNSSGTSTTARTLNGSTVTIEGFPSSLYSETLAAGIGLMVSKKNEPAHSYIYHKILGKEEDIKQLSDDINDFQSRYRVGSSNPTSSLDAGDLFFNTSTNKLLVYNATNTAWEEAQSIGNFFISTLTPAFNGSLQDFTLSNAPANVQQIILSINGVIQKPNAGTSTPSEGFALSGSTIKLASPPASGSDYFAIVMGSTVNIGTPSNNTVTTAILQNDSVNADKIAAGAVGATELGANAVITSKIADESITLAKLAHGTSSNNGKFLRANNGADPTFESVITDLVNDTSPQLGGLLDTNGSNIKFADSSGATINRAIFGTGDDLQIYHNGSHSYALNSTGQFILGGDTVLIKDGSNSEVGLKYTANGSIELYHDDAKKFETTSAGTQVSGNLVCGTVTLSGGGLALADDDKVVCGNGDDLQIYHDGSYNWIKSGVDGRTLHIDHDITQIRNHGGTEVMGKFIENGAAELYYDNSKKLETVSNGAKTTGRHIFESGGGNAYFTRMESSGNLRFYIYDYPNDSTVQIGNYTSTHIDFITNNNVRFRLQNDGHLRPYANNSYDLGTSSYRWRNVYTNDLNLSNEGSSNDVDGTWGNWTIQEGESDLFLKNNRSGKKYKFNLTEVS